MPVLAVVAEVQRINVNRRHSHAIGTGHIAVQRIAHMNAIRRAFSKRVKSELERPRVGLLYPNNLRIDETPLYR